MNDKIDNLYASQQSGQPFSFNHSVAEVFPDMIKRSVPGYDKILRNITRLSSHFVKPDTNCYDLGCSLGAASLAMSEGIQHQDVTIVAVDNSDAMLAKCKPHIDAFKHKCNIELIHDNIQNISITNASMVVLNFTLQFLPTNDRTSLLGEIYQGMNDDGVLLISEKICFEDETINQLINKLHHQFKSDNGYSQLEISQKRDALEDVLIPQTLEQHIYNLKDAGFKHIDCWFQQYNFVSIIAIK
ncbi:MAG: carboxy-S-adenosyl-L-methionine synthase CmoA [Gammaproteobacteria bacterium]|nr:carboxy-S-adenosyl-L-methionine synthase CmoA [Gammaproteobacteria bacterium]MDH5628577.1 carboxy-S-adenosyl-L-methionine synthase CmoA [Gammaproteobacteria bacterium]